MGRVFESITPELQAWIAKQRMFFIATAPRNGKHINISPKGIDGTIYVSEDRVMYLDTYGSGAETIAHVTENGRICIMFCSMEGSPRIVRLHGYARIVHRTDSNYYQVASETFTSALSEYNIKENTQPLENVLNYRAVIVIDRIFRISDSCGKGVPLYTYMDQRDTGAGLVYKGPNAKFQRVFDKAQYSLDGLPALACYPTPPGIETNYSFQWLRAKKASLMRTWISVPVVPAVAFTAIVTVITISKWRSLC